MSPLTAACDLLGGAAVGPEYHSGCDAVGVGHNTVCVAVVVAVWVRMSQDANPAHDADDLGGADVKETTFGGLIHTQG